MPIDKWDQAAVIEQIADEVVETMEIAAKVVQMDARKRLLKIHDPEWGRKYRKLIALYRLTSFVKRERLAVVGLIGMPRESKGNDMGFWIEVGTVSQPPHPWLRPALLANLRDIQQLFGG